MVSSAASADIASKLLLDCDQVSRNSKEIESDIRMLNLLPKNKIDSKLIKL